MRISRATTDDVDAKVLAGSLGAGVARDGVAHENLAARSLGDPEMPNVRFNSEKLPRLKFGMLILIVPKIRPIDKDWFLGAVLEANTVRWGTTSHLFPSGSGRRRNAWRWTDDDISSNINAGLRFKVFAPSVAPPPNLKLVLPGLHQIPANQRCHRIFQMNLRQEGSHESNGLRHCADQSALHTGCPPPSAE